MASPLERAAGRDRLRFAAPFPTLGVADAMAMVVGIVIGAGIFRTPSVIAENASSATVMLLAWAGGGLMSLLGALCYAELASAYPNAGGEYHFLTRAYGKRLAFFLGWGRLAVIQTGSIALLAFVFGDYLSALAPLGTYSSAVYAAGAVVVLTALNLVGVRHGARTQNALTAIEVTGILLVIAAGLWLAPPAVVATATAASGGAADAGPRSDSLGLVMIFVLLTYGGWNEAAYLSAELRHRERTVVRALVGSILLITTLYLLANIAYVRALGIDGMAGSDAVAADLAQRAAGAGGAVALSVLVAVSALTSANATIFTGARANYALGADVRLLRVLGAWHGLSGTPRNALLVQGTVALGLVGFGTLTRRGFETMVEYTAPVFWFFVLLTALALPTLRRRDASTPRPFRVPGYPVTPVLFAGSAAYLLYASLVHTGIGALVGVAVLASGALVLLADRRAAASPTGSLEKETLS